MTKSIKEFKKILANKEYRRELLRIKLREVMKIVDGLFENNELVTDISYYSERYKTKLKKITKKKYRKRETKKEVTE